MDEVIDAGDVVGYEIDTPETTSPVNDSLLTGEPYCRYLPSVRITRRKAHEAVRQLVLVHKRAEFATEIRRATHCPVPIANDSLSDQRGEVVRILPANTLNRNGNICSWHGVVPNADFTTNKVGLDLRGSRNCLRGRQLRKVLLRQINKLVMRNTTGTNKHHAICGVIGLDVSRKIVTRYAFNIRSGPQDCASERLVLECSSMEMVEDDFFQLFVHFFLFAENDVALALDGRVLELAVLEDVGEDVNGGWDVGVEGFGVVDCVFALLRSQNECKTYRIESTYRGISVQMPTHILNLKLQLLLCPF